MRNVKVNDKIYFINGLKIECDVIESIVEDNNGFTYKLASGVELCNPSHLYIDKAKLIEDFMDANNIIPSVVVTEEGEGAKISVFDEQVGGDHYQKLKIQPMEYILQNDLGFVEGCVVKYVSRYKFKNGIEDLKKARQNLDFLIEHLERLDGKSGYTIIE